MALTSEGEWRNSPGIAKQSGRASEIERDRSLNVASHGIIHILDYQYFFFFLIGYTVSKRVDARARGG